MATFSPYSAATRSADNLPRVQWAARSRRRNSVSQRGSSDRACRTWGSPAAMARS